jgi:tripartite-type tricarboxylate transporter receptor subunit TctC
MDAIGVEIVRDTPQKFAAVLRRDADRYGKLIPELGIKND